MPLIISIIFCNIAIFLAWVGHNFLVPFQFVFILLFVYVVLLVHVFFLIKACYAILIKKKSVKLEIKLFIPYVIFIFTFFSKEHILHIGDWIYPKCIGYESLMQKADALMDSCKEGYEWGDLKNNMPFPEEFNRITRHHGITKIEPDSIVLFKSIFPGGDSQGFIIIKNDNKKMPEEYTKLAPRLYRFKK